MHVVVRADRIRCSRWKTAPCSPAIPRCAVRPLGDFVEQPRDRVRDVEEERRLPFSAADGERQGPDGGRRSGNELRMLEQGDLREHAVSLLQSLVQSLSLRIPLIVRVIRCHRGPNSFRGCCTAARRKARGNREMIAATILIDECSVWRDGEVEVRSRRSRTEDKEDKEDRGSAMLS